MQDDRPIFVAAVSVEDAEDAANAGADMVAIHPGTGERIPFPPAVDGRVPESIVIADLHGQTRLRVYAFR